MFFARIVQFSIYIYLEETNKCNHYTPNIITTQGPDDKILMQMRVRDEKRMSVHKEGGGGNVSKRILLLNRWIPENICLCIIQNDIFATLVVEEKVMSNKP